MDIGLVLGNPVFSGETGINHTGFHVDGHFLGAAQCAFNGLIINIREIASAVDADLPATATKKGHGGFLKASLGNAQF